MKNQYRIRNWSEYNAGLKHRGSTTFWLSTDVIDVAIATMSTINSETCACGRSPRALPHSKAFFLWQEDRHKDLLNQYLN